MACIWCLGEASGPASVEHIVPEVLGCPDNFTLPQHLVCRSCNNKLAHLDSAVADEFDISAFMSGVPRKHGRPPKLASRGNVYGYFGDVRPNIHFNMESHTVKAVDGTTIGAYRGSDRNIKAKFDHIGHVGRISFQVPVGKGRKFIRGIYKIAFSALAYFVGGSEAVKPKYNSIRKFVRTGAGNRRLLMAASDGEYGHHFGSPWRSESGDYSLQFKLVIMRFFVDLSEDESLFDEFTSLLENTHGTQGWTVLPILAAQPGAAPEV